MTVDWLSPEDDAARRNGAAVKLPHSLFLQDVQPGDGIAGECKSVEGNQIVVCADSGRWAGEDLAAGDWYRLRVHGMSLVNGRYMKAPLALRTWYRTDPPKPGDRVVLVFRGTEGEGPTLKHYWDAVTIRHSEPVAVGEERPW